MWKRTKGSYSPAAPPNPMPKYLLTSINNEGVIVGEVRNSRGSHNSFACVWRDSKVTDLNKLISKDLGWNLSSASYISSNGSIVATGNSKGHGHGNWRAVLLLPDGK